MRLVNRQRNTLLAAASIAVTVTVAGLAGATIVANGAAGASASRPEPGLVPRAPALQIQATYDRNGDPALVANFSHPVHPAWSICAPGAACAPAGTGARPAGTASAILTPGPTPAGTVFEAGATYAGRTYRERTTTWLGDVRATAPPRLAGVARYGAHLTPLAATWSGGWQAAPPAPGVAGAGASFDWLNVEACRTPAARRCVNLSAPSGDGFSRRPVVVGAWFTGWYLFAIDQRFAADTAFALPGFTYPAAVPAVRLGATAVASAPLGPVRGPRPPRVSILRRAIVRGTRVLVARVRCSVRCRVFVSAGDMLVIRFGRASFTGTRLVGVPSAGLGGRLRVSVRVDDGPAVNRGVRMSTPQPRPVPYTLYTHCGIKWALIRGTFWRATKPLSDGQGNPPAGWGNPNQKGTLTFLSPSLAVFKSAAGSVTFTRTNRKSPPMICS